MIRLDACIRFRSQSGAVIALTLPNRFPFAYRLDGVWYEGMYRPAGFARTLASAKVARELEEFKGFCGVEFSQAMPAITRARVPYWAKCTTIESRFTVFCFCTEKCLDAGRCKEQETT
jgi:hypothetical protein